MHHITVSNSMRKYTKHNFVCYDVSVDSVQIILGA